MELKPSTYYLDQIIKQSEERERASLEAQKSSGQYEKAAQEAAVKAEEAARKRAEQRAKDIRDIYANGSPATMWGRDAAVVSKMRDHIFQNLDNFADNPDQFAMAISQLNAYVDNATDLYRQTYKSYEDAMVRTTPGAKNPYESDGLQDGNTKDVYVTRLMDLDTMTAPEITMNEGQFFINGGKDLGTYMQERSMQADPFAPELETLPPITAKEIYENNWSTIQDKNGQNIGTILVKLFDDDVSRSRVMAGLGKNNLEEQADPTTYVEGAMRDLEQQILGLYAEDKGQSTPKNK